MIIKDFINLVKTNQFIKVSQLFDNLDIDIGNLVGPGNETSKVLPS